MAYEHRMRALQPFAWNVPALPSLLVTIIFAAACGAPDVEPDGGGGPELRRVQIGLPVAASTFLPLYLSEEEGFFTQEGLDVDFVSFRGGTDLVKAVVAGSVDVGVTSLAGVTIGIAAGQPLKAFWAGYNLPAFEWYSVPEITSLEDAKGKRFGVTRYGSSTDFVTRYLLWSHGLDPAKQAQIIQGGDSPARLAAMEAGQLDVNIFIAPETFLAEDLGYHHLASQRTLVDDYPFHVFFTTERFIAGHPKTLTALLRAHARGVRLTKNDRERALTALVNRGRVSAQYAERTYEDFIPYIYEDGRLPSQKGLDVFFEMGVEFGQYEETWPRERYWTSAFVDTFEEWKP